MTGHRARIFCVLGRVVVVLRGQRRHVCAGVELAVRALRPPGLFATHLLRSISFFVPSFHLQSLLPRRLEPLTAGARLARVVGLDLKMYISIEVYWHFCSSRKCERKNKKMNKQCFQSLLYYSDSIMSISVNHTKSGYDVDGSNRVSGPKMSRLHASRHERWITFCEMVRMLRLNLNYNRFKPNLNIFYNIERTRTLYLNRIYRLLSS